MTACHICLIEDDDIMGESLALRFELEGIDCDWHKTGKSALAALRKLPTIEKVDAPITGLRGDQTKFALTAVFKPGALLALDSAKRPSP